MGNVQIKDRGGTVYLYRVFCLKVDYREGTEDGL